MNILDLGCGENKTAGAFGVDRKPGPGVDLVWDLDRIPWPIEDNRFDRIIAAHVVEHLADAPAFFSEVRRVAKPSASIRIVTPHFSNRSAYADPTHRHAFSVRFLDFFCGSEPRPMGALHVAAHYLLEHRFTFKPFDDPPGFEKISLELTFSKLFRGMGIAALANRFVDFYEFYLAFVFPARDITAELKVRKESG